MRFRVRLIFAAVLAAVCSSSARADDIGAAARGVVRIIAIAEEGEQSSVSFGSGFAISPHHIITNAHVVEDAQNTLGDSVVAVVPAEGTRPLKGRIVAFDRTRDLAVVDVGAIRLEPLTIYSGPVDPGGHAAALGYPGNVDLATIRSMSDLIRPTSPVRSEGNISSERNVGGKAALLHTAAISRGNSGGPLVDECGRVLGMNTYTTQTESGDAPFGFALVGRELMSFLRDNGEAFQQVVSRCITLAEQSRREQQARDTAARTEAAVQRQRAGDQQHAIDEQMTMLQESRENHVASATLLALLALVAGGFAAALFVKDQTRAAAAVGIIAALGLIGGTYAFFTRPALKVEAPKLTAQPAAADLSGKLLCQVKPELSRITVSSTTDLAMTWDRNGCMNGRTQYVADGAQWTRVLVPNGSETVSVQEFDPAKGEYVSTRYLLPQIEMERMRAIRAENVSKSCVSDSDAIEQLQQVTQQLISSLPAIPNEKLVYRCSRTD